MIVPRETIMAALFDLLKEAAPFKLTGRRVELWTRVSQFPALFLRNAGDMYPGRVALGLPAKVTMECEIWLYSKTGGEKSAVPCAALNDLIDAVETSLVPPAWANGKLSLSSPTYPQGLVLHVWIEGKIEIDPGDLDNIGKAMIPLKILVPG